MARTFSSSPHDEAALDQPLPRRGLVWRHINWGSALMGLLLVALAALGVAALGMAIQHTAIQLAGQPIEGEVVGMHINTDSDGDSTYRLDLKYLEDGRPTVESVTVDSSIYQSSNAGSMVPVRHLVFPFGAHIAPDGAYGRVLWYWVFALIWNPLMYFAIRALIYSAQDTVRLLRYGTAAAARITDKNSDTDADTTTHYLRFTLKAKDASGDSRTVLGKQNVSRSEYHSVEVGQTFTALYLPENPETCALFQFM